MILSLHRLDRLTLGMVLPAVIACPAQAAGGHHAVDDATILDPGQCQLETWLEHAPRDGRSLQHAGAACRLGDIEAGLNLDQTHTSEHDHLTTGPQIKWATAIDEHWAVGLAVAAKWRDTGRQYLGSTITIPVTWQPADPWLVHVNLARDVRPGQPDATKGGVAVEWTPQVAWTAIAERFRDGGANCWRLAGRWNVSPLTSVDLSQARSLDGRIPAWWTVGLNLAFDR